MKKIPGLIAAVLLLQSFAFSQSEDLIQGPTLGVQFFFNDFKSAEAVRKNSLAIVFKNQEFGNIKEMSPGLSISYTQGISKYFDISARLSGSFLDYPMPNHAAFGEESLLLEGDVGIRGKTAREENGSRHEHQGQRRIPLARKPGHPSTSPLLAERASPASSATFSTRSPRAMHRDGTRAARRPS